MFHTFHMYNILYKIGQFENQKLAQTPKHLAYSMLISNYSNCPKFRFKYQV